jgi:hypothetical protein
MANRGGQVVQLHQYISQQAASKITSNGTGCLLQTWVGISIGG